MAKRPLVSVVTAAFNAARHIDTALASVLAQVHQDFEVIVVDDGSTDATGVLVERLARRDSRVRLDVLPANSGRPAVARNRGLALAQGELVAFLDADDVWTPRRLADQIAVMQRMPDLVLVYSMFKSIGVRNPLAIEYGVKPLPHRAATTRQALERENTIPCSSVLARRTVLMDIGAFDEDPGLAAVEDYDLWLRVSECGPIGFIPRLHGFYRVHPLSISRATDMTKQVRYLYQKRGIRQAPGPRLHRGTTLMAIRTLGHLSVEFSVRTAEAWQQLIGQPVDVKRAVVA